MAIKSLNPYLNFDGNAGEAIAFYQRALGATVHGEIMRFGEIPGQDIPADQKDRVMHAHLRIGGGEIMISDSRPGELSKGDPKMSVAVHLDDVAETTKLFTALSEGATVTMPLGDTFWGATFGMLTDRFGIHWMFNCEKQQP